tara:strand:+ start:307 stop:927 length:621 start_codon:yes stop_codon:yes gene_type:complete
MHAQQCRAHVPANIRSQTKKSTSIEAKVLSKRQFLSLSSTAALFLISNEHPRALASEEGGVNENGLLLVNYEGRLRKDGTVFDSTYGGNIVSTSGNSVSVRESVTQPVVINLNPNAIQPGQVKGLKRGLIGAKRGDKITIVVKPEDGFGSKSITSPLRVQVPADSELEYTVEVLRVSSTGIDDLFKGVSLCGVGVANKTTAGCSDL